MENSSNNQKDIMINLAGHQVSAVLTEAENPEGVMIIGHGRINDLNHFSILAACEGALRASWSSLRFNWPYRERGDEIPDDMETLLKCHKEAVEEGIKLANPSSGRFVIAGKSLAGRTAAFNALENKEAAAVAFLGYPLHPPGLSSQAGPDVLPEIKKPLLIVQGEKDQLCDLEVMKKIAEKLEPEPMLKVVSEADHGFEGYDLNETTRIIASAFETFLKNL